MQIKIQQIKDEVKRLIAKANERYNITLPEITLRFDLTGRSAGQAIRKQGLYSMRFNKQMMMNAGWDHIINDTVPHELAHVIGFFTKKDFGHGDWWRACCIALGGTGKTRHSCAVMHRGGTFAYTTSTGQVFNVSNTIHKKIQAGCSYTLKADRSAVNSRCAWVELNEVGAVIKTAPAGPATAPRVSTFYIGQPEVPRTPKPIAVKHTLTTTGTTKAAQVRGAIVQAKELGLTMGDVAAWAVMKLGMSLSLALVYCRNNWDKV